MAKFHITITNNETGAVERDLDVYGIVAGLDLGDKTVSMNLLYGSAADYAQIARAAEKAVARVLGENPEVAKFYKELYMSEPSEK
jgi:hypothetical protein